MSHQNPACPAHGTDNILVGCPCAVGPPESGTPTVDEMVGIFAPRGPQRPWWCQDHSCAPDANTPGAQMESEGQSGWCVGRTAEPLVTTRHGVEHVNDGHWCFRSPVRGVVMLEVREGDLDLIARTAGRALRARGRQQFNHRWYFGDADSGDQEETL